MNNVYNVLEIVGDYGTLDLHVNAFLCLTSDVHIGKIKKEKYMQFKYTRKT